MNATVSLLITLLFLGLIIWLVFWIIDLVPLPDPPKLIIKVVIGVIVLLYLLGLFVGFAPFPTHFYR